jgi:hypothetical protein
MARRTAIRLLVLAALVGVGFLMHRIGKEFDVLIDNGTVSIDGVKYAGMEYGNVTIDGDDKRGFDMWSNDRVIKKMVGTKHKLLIKVLNEDDDSVIKSVEREITLDFNPRAEMVSVSAIIAEANNIRTQNPLYQPEPVFVPDDPPVAPVGGDMTGDDILGGAAP